VKFVGWLDERGGGWCGLDAGMVGSYVGEVTTSAGSVETSKAMVTALRSLLRFALQAGWVVQDLTGAVLPVASWRLASTPSPLPDGVVGRLLASCDVSTLAGRRDRAVLELLAGLGLRRGEVASLDVGDLDWHAGLITVTGKASRIDKLPLPGRAGEAVAAYVMGGRTVLPGALFLTVRRPWRRLDPAGVSGIVRQACRRSGLEPVGPHRLRHTLASELLRAGAGLPEIGQVLRHASLHSTAGYAKIDWERLRLIARPWPMLVAGHLS